MEDDPDDPSSHDSSGCGIWWLWQKLDDPFQIACDNHDDAFDRRAAGDMSENIRDVNRRFLDEMLEIAGSSRRLRARAYFFYNLARAWSATVRRKLWK